MIVVDASAVLVTVSASNFTGDPASRIEAWLSSFFHSVIRQPGGDPGRNAVAVAPMCEQEIGQIRG